MIFTHVVKALMQDNPRQMARAAAAMGPAYSPDTTIWGKEEEFPSSISFTLLQLAATHGKAKAVRFLLDGGASVDGRARKSFVGLDDDPYDVVLFGEPDSAEFFYGDSARTPLMAALMALPNMDERTRVAKSVVARMLTAHGANVMACDSKGLYALHFAVGVRLGCVLCRAVLCRAVL